MLRLELYCWILSAATVVVVGANAYAGVTVHVVRASPLGLGVLCWLSARGIAVKEWFVELAPVLLACFAAALRRPRSTPGEAG